MRGGVKTCLLALALPALGGCAVIAVGGAVVGAGVTAVEAGYAVGKGVVKVATSPFRDSDEEKEQKRLKALQDQQH